MVVGGGGGGGVVGVEKGKGALHIAECQTSWVGVERQKYAYFGG